MTKMVKKLVENHIVFMRNTWGLELTGGRNQHSIKHM